ncbi:fatty acyl-AMP ligase [Streptomyces cyaneus]|uniref:fatty acyl-AMP ligase n=1 Tax=Streptomyces cyaneus TaxID=1904 RepID=UPI000FF87561|nr:fatty acyl-AMP ligase [Streptomyces cyaneus]
MEPAASPPRGLSLPEILAARAQAHPDALALRFLPDGTTDHPVDWTYRDLDRRSRLVARGLRRRGLAGGRMVLALDPGLDYVAALFGVLRAGCTVVPAFPPSGRRAVARFVSVLADCAPQAALADGRFASKAAELAGAYPNDGNGESVQWIFPDERPCRRDDGTDTSVRLADPALIQYSSGSTGDPKGIVLTHENLVGNCRALEAHIGMEPDRVGCSWLPPYHDMGLMGTIMLAVHGGWPLVMMAPGHFVQDPHRWLKALTEYRVTITVGPNFAFDLCTSSISDADLAGLDLSSLRQVFCGSEPISAATLERFRERFAGCGYDAASVIPCYGLAEATLFVTGSAATSGAVRTEPLDGTGTPVVGCGIAAVGHEVLVVDPGALTVLPEGRVGEIWVAGPNVAAGYWRRPDLSAETFGARLSGATEAGRKYLRTGDLGFVRDGELFVTGRLKDLIVVDGRNLYPQDLEASVERCHGELRRSAVFSVPGEGEQVVVVAEFWGRSREFATAERTLRAEVTAAITGDHGVRPAEMHFGPPGTVLTTTSGKVRRRATRAAFLEGTLKRFAVPYGSTAAAR